MTLGPARRYLPCSLATVLVFALAGCNAAQPAARPTQIGPHTAPPPETRTRTSRPTVAIITTGGTIAMRQDDSTGDLVPALSGDDLVAAVPQLRELAHLRLVPLVNIDSRDMTPELWLRLARQVNRTLADPQVVGVVVTHGTDTMEDSAYLVDRALTSDKPVVFTGAMRAASAPDADGPRNLLNAVRQVLAEHASGRGATITFNGKILPARRATKVHTNSVDPFEAHAGGPIGEVDDERVTWFSQPERPPALPLPDQLPKVDLVYCYPGADGSPIDAAIERGAAGVVVCGYGIGNVNQPVFEAIHRARSRGVAVVLTTRVRAGRVYPAYGGDGGGTSLKRIGVVFGGDRLPWKARVLLMLALPVTDDPVELQRYFD